MRLPHRLALVVFAFVGLGGFTIESASDAGAPPPIPTQPDDERAAQDALPISQDPFWAVLAGTRIDVDEQQGLYSAAFSEQAKALDGQQVTVTGFMLPLEASDSFHHFLLSKRTPTCFFCPPGQPNEIVDVWVDDAAEWDDGPVTVTGHFSLMDDREMGLFFKLSNASIQ